MTVKTSSIESRYRLLLIAFALLLVISVFITFRGLGVQKTDAAVINMAGRQRMLVQQMTRLAQEIADSGDPMQLTELRQSIATFESTQSALRSGGTVSDLTGGQVELPAANGAEVLAALDQVDRQWVDFQSFLDALQSTERGSPFVQATVENIYALSPGLAQSADRAVGAFERASKARITRLTWFQAGFLAAALLLLAAGRWLTVQSVVVPLGALSAAAGRIGAGDLDSSVHVAGPAEVRLLSQALEQMRLQLQAAKGELLALNESLEERVFRRTRELEALYTVGREISSHLDIQHVLRLVTDTARELLGGQAAYLCLLDRPGEWMHLQAASGPAKAVVECSSPARVPMVEQVLAGEDALLSCLNATGEGGCEIMAAPYRLSHLAAPLRVGERVIGALCIGSTHPDAFGADAIDLLTRLAGAAAIALENARLYEQAERTATLEERQRLAAEMHDGLAQTLSFLQMNIDRAHAQVAAGDHEGALQILDRSQRAVDQASLEIRRAIASLHETFPLHNTLQEQLSALMDEFSVGGVVVDCIFEVKEPVAMSREMAEQVLRVAREALVNARNHSQARCLGVCLRREGDAWQVVIEDDGQGFDLDSLPCDDGRPHFGIQIMHARAARLGGVLEIQSGAGAGTRVILNWPVQPAAPREQS